MNEYSDLAQLLRILETKELDLGTPVPGTFAADELEAPEEGAAYVFALAGDDTVRGGTAGDQIAGNAGDDELTGRGGDDIILGGIGDDLVRGGGGLDTLIGNEGDDTILGLAGRDLILGGDGDDKLFGGNGNDRINAGDGRNLVNGGEGVDAVVLDGLLSDYTFTTLDNGAIDIRSKTDEDLRTVVTQVEYLRDSTGAAVDAEEPNTTLQLLHVTDLEGNADAVENAPNFATIVEALEDEYETTLTISSGDNYIPSPFSNAAGAADPDVRARLNAVLNDVTTRLTGETYDSLQTEAGRFDIAIMNAIGFDASAVGNHELDFGQEQFLDIIGARNGGTPNNTADDTWTGANFPYLSANARLGPDSPLQSVYDGDGIRPGETSAGTIAPFTIIEENGEAFGVIGATTQLLETITSTTGDPDNPNDDVSTVSDEVDMQALADAIQPIVDSMEANGVNKIILSSHLQQLGLERELSGLLDGVDIYIAGGSDTILADEQDRLREDDEAAEGYPIVTQDAGGNDVAIVSTDGQYTYVGRLVAEFDAGGNLIADSIDPNVSGAYATDEQGVLDVTGEADLDTAISNSEKGAAVRDLVNVVQDAVLETSGNNFFAEQDVDLNGERAPGVRSEETNLGNLTADANLAVANGLSDEPVLLSLKNGGGIRASIPNDDGLVSELEIQEVLAFNNGLQLVTLTPQQLYEVLNHGVSGTTYDDQGNPVEVDGRFPQVAGVEFNFDPSRPADSQVQDVILKNAGPDGGDVKIFEDGEATPNAADFADGIRVVTLGFLVGGGDGYPYPDFVAGDPDFADVQSLVQPDVIADGAARFTNVGTEQDALAEYLADNFPVDGEAGNNVDLPDTAPDSDMRIQNLAVPGVSDIDTF